MARRPTEEDEHWTARQRLRKARRQEVAILYEQRVVPTLATGCHIPGRTQGAPNVAHNSLNEAINYCGQVLEGPRPAIERLLRGDYYKSEGGGVGPGPGSRPEGKSFRCRAEQPYPADGAPTPLVADSVPTGSIRSTCGGRLMYDHKQRNLGLASHDLPLKPLVDPLPLQKLIQTPVRTASAPAVRTTTAPTVRPAPAGQEGLLSWDPPVAATTRPNTAVAAVSDRALVVAAVPAKPTGVTKQQQHQPITTPTATAYHRHPTLEAERHHQRQHHDAERGHHHQQEEEVEAAGHVAWPDSPKKWNQRDEAVETDHYAYKDAAVSTRGDDDEDCAIAVAETISRKKPHHCHHRHHNDHHVSGIHPRVSSMHQHHSTSRHVAHQDPSVPTRGGGGAYGYGGYGGGELPTTEQISSIPIGGVAQRRDPLLLKTQRPGYLTGTRSSKTKEAQVIVEKGPHYRPVSAPMQQSARPMPIRQAYENALQIAKGNAPGASAVISQRELVKIRDLANKPPTPRLQPKSHKPKDSENFLV